MGLATESLKLVSTKAAFLWKQLETTQGAPEIDQLFNEIWVEQTQQEITTDLIAELADQIDAEIEAVTARLNHLVNLHHKAIDKLKLWRKCLDDTIINLNEQGHIETELVGIHRSIKIKENPPTCEILVDPEQLPEVYQKVQTKITPDKKAITNAWKKGIPVEGTQVYRKRSVSYSVLKTQNLQEAQSNTKTYKKRKNL